MNKLGYQELTDSLFDKFRGLLFTESGITLKDYKKYLLINRLSKFVGDDRPFKSFEDYYSALLEDKSGNHMVEFVNALTTNYSFFFREEIHFNHLKSYLAENGRSEPYIRLWSAACSTGEEPYSMAISCQQALSNLHGLDIKILATDISTKVLNIASNANYHYTKVRGHIEDRELKSFFNLDRSTNSFCVKPELRNLITFRHLNLLDDYPFQKNFDVVFLRNVLIYFDNREKEIVINKIYDHVKPGGFLILGLSESLVGVKHPFHSLKNSIHQK